MTSMSNGRPILIMAGGTGGHVFPALAVARELKQAGMPVVWLGTRAGLEAKVVPQAGFKVAWIKVSGLRGKGLLKQIAAPFMLMHALWQSLWVMLSLRPRAVLGMGGFVTGPGGLMAWLTRRPLLIHEQNSIAGLTNRLLAPLAKCVMEAFPGALADKAETIHTGNPVRADIAALAAPDARFASHDKPLHLLVLGGSLGAQALNETVPQALALLPEAQRPQVRHQAGAKQIDACVAAYQAASVQGDVKPFIENMAEAYGWADLVICRSGALTVAELAAAGVGAVMVPYPHAVDDHQTGNARFLADAGAGVVIQQTELTAQRLAEVITQYQQQPESLLRMATAARALAKPDAAQIVARHCLQAAGVAA